MPVLLFAVAILTAHLPIEAAADGLFEDTVAFSGRLPGTYIEVLKSEQVLRLRHGENVFREFPIAFGRGDQGL